jgi:lipopolysaccharide transport system ATP-binding protein
LHGKSTPKMTNKNIAFKADNISKIYRLGLKDTEQETLGESLFSFIKSPVKNFRKYRSLYNFSDAELSDSASSPKSSNVLWALNNVSFEINQGETVGIIGRNGAGKSTLLKVLSRITHPTRGRLEIHGRVACLLEVGTGFHQELTGRENVYLNGTVLGMRKREVDLKFDEIVAFSGVEKFLDTPVKRYSSGMRIRLGFAVAAHLEPEILIVDEVLAVGDAAFQRKCLNKMQDVSEHGRTVLFVSHNMAAVSRLCERGILLDEGKVIADGPIHDVVRAYTTVGTGNEAARQWSDPSAAPGGEIARLQAVRVISRSGQVSESIDIRQPVGLQMEFVVLKSGHAMLPLFYVIDDEGVVAFNTLDLDPEWRSRPRPAGHYTSTAWIPANFLAEGTLNVSCGLMAVNPNIPQFIERFAVAFHIVDTIDGNSARGDWTGAMPGVVRPMLDWETSYTPETSHMLAE